MSFLKSAVFTTDHSGERRNRWTEDKLSTLMKKVSWQFIPVSHTQERGDPCTNLVRANKNQVAKSNWKNQDSP